ncbi:hypothetical protein FRACYDRAFT_272739 [Fragilariopsis cylindrus CCMP1102]|uniref:Plastid lipid-associated protein/fibrillin conserved domain-containing protein n=1 Tax=Fragilariopsis cylindrus CCMP1102 TaxID=635003 RepID=A0A1E7EKN2_9STRA|nr:hypothetical protein FRACYDRAFT_272739 [Fragilariopsis cylindrus CCMP1102]|eukprot:OEU06444.1 hypothetical protein FRACYDRAFT_272739 [Fragilariopsis cylindrus CCMP1102]
MMMSQYNKNRCTTVCYYYLIILTTNYLVVLVAAFSSSSNNSNNHGDYFTSRLPLMDFHHHNHNHQSSLSSHYYNTGSSSCTQLFAAAASTKSKSKSSTTVVDDDDDDDNMMMKLRILKLIEPTKRGLATTSIQKINIEKEIRILEESCSLKLNEPARDIRMGGLWEVLYTTAPPPSNGQLGPFIGIANQKIDLENGTYSNILEIGGSKKPWLTAVLNASWEEWDGTLLEEKEGNGGEKKWKDAVVNVDDDDDSKDDVTATNEDVIDYGATSWKVDFKTITIRLFDIPLLKQQFKEGTSRVWRMSYLDNDTRIVRAGRTGKGEDDVVFYMIRKGN